MHDFERRLNRLEHQLTPAPSKAFRWVVAETMAEEAAAEATQKPGEFLVIWRVVDPDDRAVC